MPELPRITVLGAGTMGSGIAHVAALAGHPVVLFDTAADALPRALERIQKNLEGGVERGKLTRAEAVQALERVQSGADLSGSVREADVVIEAVVEDLAVKKELFETLDRLSPADAILASNTSSLPITELALATRRPAQVIGLHFFNPVHIMKLVEVVVHPRCAAETREQALTLARRMKKEPIVVRDSPGFASSRLGLVLGLEAMRMLEQEVASAEDIDKAMVLGYGHPMGPLRLTDLVGLDVRLAIADHLHAELQADEFRAPEILRRKVAAGELGKKTGRGFYTWSE